MGSNRYGLIGEKLGHSFSPIIHKQLADYDYQLYSIPRDEIDAFMKKRDFAALNVTIPYKQTVMPYCDELSPAAKKIGCVNTLVMRPDGTLFGDNTDYLGFLSMAKKAGIDFNGKKVLILGSGGTSLTARTAAADSSAREVIIVSRSGAVNYDNVYQITDADIVVNTTPVGMYPNNGVSAIDLEKLPNISGVLDVIYNPLNSALIMQAKRLGIPCASGLRMLVAQAKYASERFTGKTIDDAVIAEIEKNLLMEMVNIVLIGMPGCGKTTLSRRCAKKLGREMDEIDSLIVERAGCDIPTIFREQGEDAFRDLESLITKECSNLTKRVISTGGGVIKRPENIENLRQNSVIIWVKRPIEQLPTKGRPLSSAGDDAVRKLWEERKALYAAAADYTVENTGSHYDAVKKILEGYREVISNKWA